MNGKIASEHLSRRAVVYVRQSTPTQVSENLESQRRQYALVERARELGFRDVETIDDDLGRSGSGLSERPGFQRLVAEVCGGHVGAVLSLEASRLARNGRDWHHLIDFCGLVGAIIIDSEGIYDPRLPNDRLLLGLKGSMSEFELSLFRQRSFEAIRNKAKRGELTFRLPVGLRWSEANTIELDPDLRVREALALVFRRYHALGSVRQLLLWMREEKILVPATASHREGTIVWKLPVYNTLHSIITNPCYAGAYAYGKTGDRRQMVSGRAHKTSGHAKAREEWAVLIRDHHPGYVSWEQYERNQTMLTNNAHMMKRVQPRAGRGGRGLLGALLRCRRCGRMIQVTYQGKGGGVRYSCRGANLNHGERNCISFGGLRAEEAVASGIMDALTPRAIDAAIEASARVSHERADQERAVSLELEQARYEARRAARRYEAVDPDNRLVASELEARWNAQLTRVNELEVRLAELQKPSEVAPIDRQMLLSLANTLPAVWNSEAADMRLKQRIVRVLINEIVADVDEERGEIVLVLHWAGGQHSELRVRKFRTGQHRRVASEEAFDVVRRMASRWPDDQIAATLNRLGLLTGVGNTWNARRVYSIRRRLQLAAFDPMTASSSKQTLTLTEAARELGVHESLVRRLLRDGLIRATQVVANAPYEISPDELKTEEVLRCVQRAKNVGRNKRQQAAERLTLPLPGLTRR